jgi:hypothetical protein
MAIQMAMNIYRRYLSKLNLARYDNIVPVVNEIHDPITRDKMLKLIRIYSPFVFPSLPKWVEISIATRKHNTQMSE